MDAIAREGELILYADKARKHGKIHDTIRDIWSEEQDLQMFFKWGLFEPIETSAGHGAGPEVGPTIDNQP